MRPYVLVSCAVSLDGRLDDASGERLILSGAEDLARVDAARAGCDAILVGAGTLRTDDPRLLVREPALRAGRLAEGRPEQPLRVVVSRSGELDPSARLFTAGDPDPATRLVYVAREALASSSERLGKVATVVAAGRLTEVMADLAGRGAGRVMVEGGATVVDELLREDLVDELQVFVAPFLVGGAATPRLGGAGPFPQSPARPMTLTDVRRVGAGVVLTYLVGAAG